MMWIIAHRGASAEFPDNTLPAFERAVEAGADAFEVDVLLSRDGRLVVRHDDLIRRDGEWRYVRDLTFDELTAIDAGKGLRMLSADDVFERFHKKTALIFDLKTHGLTAPLARFLADRRPLQNVYVSSFLSSEIAKLRGLCPEVRGMIGRMAPEDVREETFKQAGTRMLCLERSFLSASLVRRFAKEDIQVYPFTVNVPWEAALFRSWGVSGIFTDDPAGVLSYLRPSSSETKAATTGKIRG